MKIVDVSVTLFAWRNIPPVRYGDRNPVTAATSELGLVTLCTDSGIEGHAFLGSSIRGARLDVMALIRHLKPVVMEQDPLERERLWIGLNKLSRAATPRTIGAIDVALWDIAGKAAGLPIHRLLGGYRRKLPAYASSATLGTVDDYVAEALAMKRRGFTAYKIHPPHALEPCIAACRAVRAAVGPDMRLMLDPAGAFDYSDAVRLGRAIEALGFHWYEDPLAEDDLTSYVKLRAKLDIPIMATEYSPGGFHAYAPWLMAQATDYLRGDVAVKGGLTGLIKGAHLAEAFHMNYEIHHGGNSLNNVAQLHAAMAMRNCEYFEILLPAAAQQYAVLDDIEPDAEGYVHAIDKPGLGVAIDFELIRRETLEVLR
ncbi:MAG: mandelate racemase [Alphaproteobacteria bacterium]|nr:mandelate racemase [Alphaproteobacteria bacterium]